MENFKEFYGDTGVTVEKLAYTWRICAVSLKKGTRGFVLKSSKFYSTEGVSFRMIISCMSSRSKVFSLIIESEQQNQKRYLPEAKCSILNGKVKISEKNCSLGVHKEGEGNSSILIGRIDSFLQDHWSLEGNYRDYLHNGILTLRCEITLTGVNQTESTTYQILSREEKEFQHAVYFCDMFNDSKYSDIIFKVGGQEFAAHKAVLSAVSPVFEAMFTHQMAENSSGVVEITDMDVEVFKEMMMFIYTGKVNKIEELAQKLLVAADKYSLNFLNKRCQEVLIRRLDVENAAKILELSDLHSAVPLKSKVIEFIRCHLPTVVEQDSWKHLIQSKSEFVDEVMGG